MASPPTAPAATPIWSQPGKLICPKSRGTPSGRKTSRPISLLSYDPSILAQTSGNWASRARPEIPLKTVVFQLSGGSPKCLHAFMYDFEGSGGEHRFGVHEFTDAQHRKLPSVAAVFDAAKGQSRIRLHGTIDEYAARLNLRGDAVRPLQIFGPDARTQTVAGL